MLSQTRLALVSATLLVASGYTVGFAADDYDYDAPASYLDHLAVEREGGVDFTGDGRPDNSFGALVDLLESVPGGAGDLDALLAEAIAEGALVVGAAWPSFEEGIVDSDAVEGHFFELVDADDDPGTHDEFYVDRRSFPAGSSVPFHRLANGQVTGGHLRGEATSFPLLAPFVASLLFVTIEDVRVDARVSVDANGIAVTEGSIAGVIPVEELVGAFNELFRAECGCLALEEGEDLILLSVVDQTIDLDCNSGVDTVPCDDSDGACGTAGMICQFVSLIPTALDVDTDGDFVPDAFSAFFRFTMVGTSLLGPSGPPDCNGNGVPDNEDIASQTSADENVNGIPDECEPPPGGVRFRRGDANADGGIDISDAVFGLAFLFLGGPAPTCLEAVNSNDDAAVDISDASYTLASLFLGGPPPSEPYLECGFDQTPPSLACDSFDPCGGVAPDWPSAEGVYRAEGTIEPLLPEALPPFGEIVDAIFSDPPVFVLQLMAAGADGSDYFQESPWDLVFECQGGVGPGGECLGEITLTTVGEVVAAILEDALDEGAERTFPRGLTFREILAEERAIFENAEDFTLHGALAVTGEPDEAGLLGDGNILTIDEITWRWQDSEQTLALPEDALVSSEIAMAFEYSEERGAFVLTVSPFALGLSYTQLALQVLEGVVLPQSFGPAFDGLDDLVVGLVDCEEIASAIDDEGLGAVSASVESACDTLQVTTVEAAERWLASITAGVESEYVLATPPGGCELTVELSGGREVVVRFGGPLLEESCPWTGEVRIVGDSDGETVEGVWWADRL